MSLATNPDRAYVGREYRATLRLGHLEPERPIPLDVSLPGVGAALMNISAGGCCLRLSRSDLPFSIDPGSHISAMKLLHPNLDSTPIRGRIAWSREDPPYVLIGVQFIHIGSPTLDSIRLLIDHARSCRA